MLLFRGKKQSHFAFFPSWRAFHWLQVMHSTTGSTIQMIVLKRIEYNKLYFTAAPFILNKNDLHVRVTDQSTAPLSSYHISYCIITVIIESGRIKCAAAFTRVMRDISLILGVVVSNWLDWTITHKPSIHKSPLAASVGWKKGLTYYTVQKKMTIIKRENAWKSNNKVVFFQKNPQMSKTSKET